MFLERPLEAGQQAAYSEPLDRAQLSPVDLRGEEETRADGDAVDEYGAAAADAVLAADVRSR